jgi:hypothetical protein
MKMSSVRLSKLMLDTGRNTRPNCWDDHDLYFTNLLLEEKLCLQNVVDVEESVLNQISSVSCLQDINTITCPDPAIIENYVDSNPRGSWGHAFLCESRKVESIESKTRSLFRGLKLVLEHHGVKNKVLRELEVQITDYLDVTLSAVLGNPLKTQTDLWNQHIKMLRTPSHDGIDLVANYLQIFKTECPILGWLDLSPESRIRLQSYYEILIRGDHMSYIELPSSPSFLDHWLELRRQEELLWLKRAKYLLNYPLAKFLRNPLPESPDLLPKWSGVVRSFFKSRMVSFSKKNCHLWYSWLQSKRACSSVSSDFVNETYLKHLKTLTSDDPLGDYDHSHFKVHVNRTHVDNFLDSLPDDELKKLHLECTEDNQWMFNTTLRINPEALKKRIPDLRMGKQGPIGRDFLYDEEGRYILVDSIEENIDAFNTWFSYHTNDIPNLLEHHEGSDPGWAVLQRIFSNRHFRSVLDQVRTTLNYDESVHHQGSLSASFQVSRGKGGATEDLRHMSTHSMGGFDDYSDEVKQKAMDLGTYNNMVKDEREESKKSDHIHVSHKRFNKSYVDQMIPLQRSRDTSYIGFEELRQMIYIPIVITSQGFCYNQIISVYACPSKIDADFYIRNLLREYNPDIFGLGERGQPVYRKQELKDYRRIGRDENLAVCENRNPHRNSAEIYGVVEPLKVRVISKGPARNYYALKPLQKALHSALKVIPGFQAIGREIGAADLVEMAKARSAEDLWFSVDYSAATDGLSTRLGLMILAELVRDLSPEVQSRAFDGLGSHNLFYDQKFCEWLQTTNNSLYREYVKKGWIVLSDSPGVKYPLYLCAPQKNGQLMGSPISFPILCLANLAVYLVSNADRLDSLSLESVLSSVLVNGDDMVYCAPDSFWDRHVDFGRSVGLEMSPGKAYKHKSYLNINSTSYLCPPGSDLPVQQKFLNSGLYFGNHKVMARVGGDQEGVDMGQRQFVSVINEILKGSLPGQECELLAQILSYHREVIKTETRVLCQYIGSTSRRRRNQFRVRNLFVPEMFGGMGLDPPPGFQFRVTKHDLKVASYLLQQFPDVYYILKPGVFNENYKEFLPLLLSSSGPFTDTSSPTTDKTMIFKSWKELTRNYVKRGVILLDYHVVCPKLWELLPSSCPYLP